MKPYDHISAVVDNNILMDLYELKMINILFIVFDIVSIPKSIYDSEIENEVIVELNKYDFIISELDEEVGYEMFYALVNGEKYKNLSLQDKLLISISKQHMYLCGSNDKLVRNTCKEFSIKHIGILGIIELAYMKKIITKDDLVRLCEKLKSDETSCYIRKNIIDDFVEKIIEK